MDDLYIMRVPVISTCHIPSHESVNDAEVLHAVYEGGWFVYMDDEIDDPKSTPIWYLDVWRWAKKHDFKWVRFDCDGDIIDELEVYKW